MRPATIILLICAVVLLSGCSSQSTNQTSTAPSASPSVSVTPNAANSTTPGFSSSVVKPKVDVCTLLSSDEIRAVQGEDVKETTPSNRSAGDLIVSQCYYGLPTPSNSVSVTLTERNPDSKGGQSVKDFWEQTFGKNEKKGESKREETKKPEAKREGEEEESAPLEPVRGLGDEAFWSASRVGGALYVLKRDSFLRISVGGKGDAETKLKKSKTLAQKALRRM
jgi:hypothetical protein